jgi:hypothetical protein
MARKFLARDWVVIETADKKYSDRIFFLENAPQVNITGTTLGATESQVVAASSRTIILTVLRDEWVTSGGTFDGQRQNIIDGLDSAQSEALGWNIKVRNTMSVGRVARTSNTVVTITLLSTETDAFKITSDEVIEVTIPATALVSTTTNLTGTSLVNIISECDQTLPPDTIATQTNLTGAVTDIDESVDTPDGNWLLMTP